MLSVILPSYNEEKMIAKATARMAEILQPEKIDYELLFIDDGSRDGTWAQINEAAGKDSHVVGVHFSRNFGKEAAMFAGLEQAKGDCCVVIDCDLQHPPEKIVEMYRLWEQGYEVVEGIKEDRGEESGLHKFAANSFYGLISKATGMDMSSSSDFKLLDRKVVDTLNSLPERNVFFRALSFWVGYKKTSVSYCVQERTEGVSKWVDKVAHQIRADEYQLFLLRTAAYRDGARFHHAGSGVCARHNRAGAEDIRRRPRRVHDGHTSPAVLGKRNYDKPRHNRLLYRPHL